MFDIGADELLLTAVVAVVVIGPKDLPKALRVVGRWVAKMRRMSSAFRSGIENVIREAELEEMEKQWRAQNAAIMAQHPAVTPDEEAQAAASAANGIPPELPVPAAEQHQDSVTESAPAAPPAPSDPAR